MISEKDISLIKIFKDKILNLKYGRKIQYHVIDDNEILPKNHLICIHKSDDDNFIVKLTYKLSSEDIVKLCTK